MIKKGVGGREDWFHLSAADTTPMKPSGQLAQPCINPSSQLPQG